MKILRLRTNDLEQLAAVKDYLESLPETVPTLPELSKKFCINTDKLKKGFRQLYGVPPYQYVLGLRLGKAKRLLRDTELPVAHIAFELGFSEPGNFSAWFKKATGVKPLGWRWGKPLAPEGGMRAP